MEFPFFKYCSTISPFVCSRGISGQEAILVHYSNIINLKIQDIFLEMAIGNLFLLPPSPLSPAIGSL